MTNQNPFLSPQIGSITYDDPRFDDYLEEEEEDIEIGMCFCGKYGEAGKTHVRMIDGQMEECGEYL